MPRIIEAELLEVMNRLEDAYRNPDDRWVVFRGLLEVRVATQQSFAVDEACAHEWLASTLPDVLCICSKCGERTPCH